MPVIRKLEIIGEAVKPLSAATKDRHPEIPWKPIAGMRDRLTHDYFGVDLALVWRVVERDLPSLKAPLPPCSNVSSDSSSRTSPGRIGSFRSVSVLRLE